MMKTGRHGGLLSLKPRFALFQERPGRLQVVLGLGE